MYKVSKRICDSVHNLMNNSEQYNNLHTITCKSSGNMRTAIICIFREYFYFFIYIKMKIKRRKQLFSISTVHNVLL
jgi:hypothetical protein